MTGYAYDAYDEPPQAPVVHWMGRRSLAVSPAGLSAAVVGAAVLGAALTLAALALVRLVEER